MDLKPLAVTLPDYPFVGALALTLRDGRNKRIAANFVNLVVKPDQPLPRVRRRGDHDVVLQFDPAAFAAQQWSQPAKPPAGKVYGYGKGYFEYRVAVPPAVARAHPQTILYLFQAGAKANRERVDWPQRSNRQDYPQTDEARPWSSNVLISLNGRPIERIDLPDDAADARGVLSHLAQIEHGSHGELVDGKIELTDTDRARLESGEPLVLRIAVPEDAAHAGGLCLFGASTGEMPLDPSLEIHTRDPLPADLGVNAHDSVTRPARP